MILAPRRKGARIGALAGIAVGLVAALLRYAGDLVAAGSVPQAMGPVLGHAIGFALAFVVVGAWVGYAVGRLRRPGDTQP